MNKEGRTFRGILYTGLMITKGGPKVVEFNCRFGDPEAQAVLMRLKTDLVDVIDAVLESRLDEIELEFDPRHACCVVLASMNYPESSPLGLPISGLDGIEASDDLQVFHAGTAQRGDEIVTAGGRILGVTALGDDLPEARKRAYEAASKIKWEGARMRSDIGA
jgi:phosphoribosylamine--glycine ligase